MPEGNQTFTVALEISGDDGRLAPDNTEAQLTILQNDDPIAFMMSLAATDEGEMLVVHVVRNGQAIDTASATFSLSLLSASAEDVSLTTSGNEVIFASGQRETEILLNITDDDIPELAEQFTLELTSTTGKNIFTITKLIFQLSYYRRCCYCTAKCCHNRNHSK